ncbi:MAG: sodium:proton antiporter [Rhizobiaceae bacterium]|nr:sodium:proton antiporter [Rhizobiaceae bacterium]
MIAQILVLTGFVLALISAIQFAAARGWLPESTLLACVGIALGGSYTALDAFAPEVAGQLSPLVTLAWPTEAYLWIFLPPLIFQAALTVDVRAMLPDSAPILLLAIVAVFVATGLIGGVLALVSGQGLMLCLLLGAVVATTDPSAVIAVFRSLGAPARLTRLVEGESLMNDAAAIAIVGILVASISEGLIAPGLYGVAWATSLSILGGGVAGYVAGRSVVALLPALDRLPVAAATLTLALPYPLYVAADELLHASGVIAVVSAGLVISALGPTRLSPSSWYYVHIIWRQMSVLAGASVFLLAAMRVPPMLGDMTVLDFVYLLVVLVAALVARLGVMFGLLPVLSWLRLSSPVDTRYKLAISWGGLRGAVTLVLGLSIAENSLLPMEDRQFVGALACSFVLASLFINGLSLRWVVERLGLTALSEQQKVLQRQAALMSSAEVQADLTRIAEQLLLPQSLVRSVHAEYEAELATGADTVEFESALTERERLSLGLIILATKEHSLIPEYGSGVISARNLDVMMRNTAQMIDAAREGGRIGYNRAATHILDPSPSLLLGRLLARFLRIDWLLMNALGDRFELMICRRAVLEQLVEFNAQSLGPFVGSRMTTLLESVLKTRLEAVDKAIAEMRASYGGDYTHALERRLLFLFALNKGSSMIDTLKAESIISAEIAGNITGALDEKWRSVVARPSVSLIRKSSRARQPERTQEEGNDEGAADQPDEVKEETGENIPPDSGVPPP